MDNFAETHADLELKLDSDSVELRYLVSVAGDFAQLVGEVAKTYAGTRDPVRWFVEIREGSTRLPVRGEARAENLSAGGVTEIADRTVEGIRQLESEAVRPEGFTDKAVESARALGRHVSDENPPIWLRNGAAPFRITQQLVVNAEKVLGTPYEVFGTVEGRLEALNIHGANKFHVYEALSGKSIDCRFGKYVTLPEVTAAVGRRVMARGLIRTRPNGDRLSVEVHELRMLPEVVSADEVLGIFQGFEVTEDDDS